MIQDEGTPTNSLDTFMDESILVLAFIAGPIIIIIFRAAKFWIMILSCARITSRSLASMTWAWQGIFPTQMACKLQSACNLIQILSKSCVHFFFICNSQMAKKFCLLLAINKGISVSQSKESWIENLSSFSIYNLNSRALSVILYAF